ncbi:MAG: tRNA (guanine(46)-N(7))-methyltransferase TrmB [Opitutales bacterium]
MPSSNTPEALDVLPPDVVAAVERRREGLRADIATWWADGEPVTLELGCGHGHYLTAFAEAHPEERCVGLDLVTKRVEKGRAKSEKRGLAKLHFAKADVREFLELLPPEARLKRVLMLFPDPWPKKRHAKKRMLQPGLLDMLAEHCDPGTPFYFRTDEPGMFAWGIERFEAHPQWAIREEPWLFEADSYFQNLMDSWQSLVARRL